MPRYLCAVTHLFYALTLSFALSSAAPAVNIDIDYTYDSNSFFGSGNPDGTTAGLQARAALEAAAEYFSEILTDTFSPISTPQTFISGPFNGIATWEWSQSFSHPGTGSLVTLNNQSIAANNYVVYAGGRGIGGNTLGVGGPGGFGWSSGGNGGGFTQGEIDQINLITANFSADVEDRGDRDGGFSAWGGAITFDSSNSNWHYDHTIPPTGNKNDFFSVALHELGHAIGVGTSPEWDSQAINGVFTGPASQAVFGGPVPVTGDGGHWADGTDSTIFGTNTPQETSLAPRITSGTRKLFTTLDAAGLTDIGWEVVAPAPQPGDYNNDGTVDAADYTVWRDALGTSNPIGSYNEWKVNFGTGVSSVASSVVSGAAVPEPSTMLFALFVMVGLAPRRTVRL